MPKLSASERAALPDRAFAYVDAAGRRRLPIHDEAHVRNALARFERVKFEDEAARDRARRRLLSAAKKHGIVPVGFITGQLASERSAGSPDLSTLPTGTVTFLLCDIEGSTVLLRTLGNEYAQLLRDVRAIIRTAVHRAGGHKVDAHGDEYFAVFEAPAAAVRAACEIQTSMATHTWPKGQQVRVRAGIHTGRPTLTDDGYVGLAVHAVARICSVGHGGQVLVSTRTKTLLKDVSEFRFRSLGRHKLAGLAAPETLHQVLAKGLETRFPPPRTS